jgi:hypothetical protein
MKVDSGRANDVENANRIQEVYHRLHELEQGSKRV